MNFDHLAMPMQDPDGADDEASKPPNTQHLTVRLLPLGAAAPGSDEHRRMARSCAEVAQLGHPNIVPVHECGWRGDRAFVSTPSMAGEPLAQFRARVGALPALQSLAFAAQLLSVLDAAHRHGLVHLAVGPDVLLVTRRGQLQVDGFGWAALMAAGGAELSPYSAPEQRRGERADHRADLYSAAVVIHELLAHALPIRWQHDNAGPGSRPREQHIGDAPHARLAPELQAVFRRALAANPRARYASAGDLYAALQLALGTPVWKRPAAPPRVKSARAHQRLVAAARALFLRARIEDRSPSSMADRAGLALAVACAAALVLAANAVLEQPRRDHPRAIAATGLVNGPLQEGVRAGESPLPPAPIQPAKGEPVAASSVEPAPLAQQFAGRRASSDGEDAKVSDAGHVRSAGASGSAAAPQRETRPSPRSPAQAALRTPRPASRAALKPKAASVASLNCRGEESLVRELCQVLRCATAEFRRHPLCVRLHAEGRARARLAELRAAP